MKKVNTTGWKNPGNASNSASQKITHSGEIPVFKPKRRAKNKGRYMYAREPVSASPLT